MIVLGIHDAFDSGAALVADGEIRVAVNEERLNRIKYYHEERARFLGLPVVVRSAFPRLAIEEVLRREGLKREQIDVVALPHARPRDFLAAIPARIFAADFRRALGNLPLIAALSLLYAYNKRRLLDSTLRQLRAFGIPPAKARFIPHHLAHAASAYRTSGWNDALVMVVDLEGDLTSTTVWRGRGNRLTPLHETFFPFASAGAFYGCATAAIGFRKHLDECKIMGLAAYGKPGARDALAHQLAWDEARGALVSRGTLSFPREDAALAARFDKKDLAASAQKRLEEALVPFVQHWMARTGCRRLAYAGGVAHNVIANQRLQEIPGMEALHVFPHPGDGGLACGAALEHWYQHARRRDGRPSYFLRDAYLGPEYPRERLEAALRKYGLPVRASPDIGDEAGRLLARGLVLGLFQGRMELGPRALGNRSILASPRGAEMKEKVNRKVKFRENWRPFALSVLDECRDEYLEKATDARFMLLGFQVVAEKFESVRSASHVDGSTRPQTVRREECPRYHAIISGFRKHSGIGGVLNTSLNRRGEPICCTPEEAIECFLGSDMDGLILDDFLVEKSDVAPDQLRRFQAIEADVGV